MNFKQFAQISRWQTYPATLILFFTPYLVAGGELFSLSGLWLVLLTWVIHGSTFAHNVVSDYHMDKKDPSKSDHPLTSGEVDYGHAVRVFGPYLFLVEVGCLLTTFYYLWGDWNGIALGVSSLFLMIGSGTWYNNWSYSSRSKLAFLPISVCWTSMAAWAWFLGGGGFGGLFYLILGYAFLRIFFQISVSGRLKEIGFKSEANELKAMGAELKDKIFHPGMAFVYAVTLSALEAIVGTNISLQISNLGFDLAGGVLLVIGLILTVDMMRKQEWDREKALDRMSKIEIVSIYALPIIMAPIVGYFEVAVLLTGGIVYFALFNKVLWGRASSPNV